MRPTLSQQLLYFAFVTEIILAEGKSKDRIRDARGWQKYENSKNFHLLYSIYLINYPMHELFSHACNLTKLFRIFCFLVIFVNRTFVFVSWQKNVDNNMPVAANFSLDVLTSFSTYKGIHSSIVRAINFYVCFVLEKQTRVDKCYHI